MPATTANPLGRQLTPWLILLLALAVLAAGLGYDRYNAYRDLDAQERQRLVQEASAVRENLSARLQTTSNALAALRADLPWLLTQPEGLSRLNRRLAALAAATEGLRTLLVVDVNGIAIASNRPELIGKNFREPERYQTMSRDANPDQLYVSAPFKTPLGLWAISLGRVILDDQGRFNGYLLAIVDPDYFRLLLSSTLYAPDMRVSVVHGEGLVVFRTPDPEGLTGQDVRQLPHSFFRRFWDSGAEHLVLEGPSAAPGGERLAALQAIRPRETTADQPLIVTTSRDLATILAPWKQETLVRVALFGLIALVAAIGLGAFQRRQRAYYLLQATEAAKRAATAANLQESERRFRQLFEHLPIAYQSVDGEGRWLDANQPLADLLGFANPEEMLGQSFVDFWDTSIRDQFDANFARFKTNLSIDGEVPLRRRDGSPLTAIFAGRIQRDDQGRFLRTHCILIDITERRAMEAEIRALNAGLEAKVTARTAEARAASAAKSEFLAHMSHEIRTPLNGVLGLLQLLQREPLTPDQRDLVTRIQGAGQSLLAILNDILDFSKIEAGQLRLEDRPFRLDALPTRLDSLLGAVARGKGLALRIDGPDADLGPLRGDVLRLEQVLVNLIGNAIKFTERGEVAVTFTTLASDLLEARLRFEVHDTGIGIGPEALARLFTPFTQADSSTTRRFGGTGLGLSICKRLVELMGGTLGAESVPGEGSTFWFEIPFRHAADDEVPAPAAPVAAPPTGPRLRGLRILVVDDSAMNRDLVERTLTLEGARVSLAADGQQALVLLQANPAGCDAVLMDVQMPVMDGRTATRLIREELGLTRLPIIALTAGVLAEEQRLIRDAGADEVLAKPLDLELLVERLAHHIGAQRLATAAAQAGTGAAAQAGTGAGSETALTATNPADASAGGQAVAFGAQAGPAAGDQAAPFAAPAGPGSEGEPVAVATAFPAIPGIDRERVALLFKDDVEFYLMLLKRLTQEAATGLAQARQALAAGDRATLALRLHSLKGNAGNVGALNLMAAAGELEAAVKAGATDSAGAATSRGAGITRPAGAVATRDVGETDLEGRASQREAGATDLEAGLADLERQVAALTAASAPWLEGDAPANATAPATVPAPPLDPVRLAVLREALGDHDLAASDHFEDLAASLTAAWGAEAVHALGEAIADLRFGEALALVDRQTSGPAA
jgi:PAS domain S-box-containing protein